MFKFLKRLSGPPEEVKPARRRRPSTRPVTADEPGPLPDVTEGNDQTDWALWEDSVMALDSQMQSLGFSSSGLRKLETPSEYQDIDAYSKVTRKDK